MYKDSPKLLNGNEAFEGYAIDLIKEIADTLSESLITLGMIANDLMTTIVVCT